MRRDQRPTAVITISDRIADHRIQVRIVLQLLEIGAVGDAVQRQGLQAGRVDEPAVGIDDRDDVEFRQQFHLRIQPVADRGAEQALAKLGGSANLVAAEFGEHAALDDVHGFQRAVGLVGQDQGEAAEFVVLLAQGRDAQLRDQQAGGDRDQQAE